MAENILSLTTSPSPPPHGYILASPGKSKQYIKKVKDGKNKVELCKFCISSLFVGEGNFTYLLILLGKCWKNSKYLWKNDFKNKLSLSLAINVYMGTLNL